MKTNGMSAPPPARPRRRAISLSTETPEKLLCSRSDHSCDCAARAREKKGARSSRINPNRLDIVKSPTVRMIPGMSSPLFNIVILIVKSDDSAHSAKVSENAATNAAVGVTPFSALVRRNSAHSLSVRLIWCLMNLTPVRTSGFGPMGSIGAGGNSSMRADQYSSSAFREGLETPRVFASMTKSLKEISSLLSSCSPSYARARSLRIMVMLKKSQRAKLTDMFCHRIFRSISISFGYARRALASHSTPLLINFVPASVGWYNRTP